MNKIDNAEPAEPPFAAAAAGGAAPARFCLWLQRQRGAKRQGIACLCGAAAALALPPFYLLPLLLFSFPALVWLLDGIAAQPAPFKRRISRAALTGWFFGFGYFTAGLWWLADAMTVDLARFWWAVPFAIFGLPAFLSCYYAFAAAAALLFWRRGLMRLIALALAFALAEYLRGLLFTGFPWNAIGLTIMPSPLFMQADAGLSLNGMNAAAVFFCSLPALWRKNMRFNGPVSAKAAFCLFAALLIADIGYGAYRLRLLPAAPAAAGLRIRLIQPAIAQEEKQSNKDREDNFRLLLALTKAAPKTGEKTPNLIIWPETAMPYLPDYNQAALARIGAALKPNQLLLAGAVRTEARTAPQIMNDGNSAGAESEMARYRFYNSMILINADGRIIAHADKAHLVPFGEYLPLGSVLRRLGLSALAQAAGPYSAARKRRLISLPNGVSVLPLICYEAIFPAESAPINGKQADIIVNITNDAWFGATPGPYQHLAQVRLRAIEQNRPLIRVANTGISAYIDARGRILAQMPLQSAGFLDISLPANIK